MISPLRKKNSFDQELDMRSIAKCQLAVEIIGSGDEWSCKNTVLLSVSLKVRIGGGGWTAGSSNFFKHACMVYSKVSKKLKRYKRRRKNGKNIVDNIDNYSGFAPAGHHEANTAISRNVF